MGVAETPELHWLLAIPCKLNLIHTRNMLDRQSQWCCRAVRLHIQKEDTARQNSADLQREKDKRQQWRESRRNGKVRSPSYLANVSNVKPFAVNRVCLIAGCQETHSTRIRRSTKHKSNTAIQIKLVEELTFNTLQSSHSPVKQPGLYSTHHVC